MSCITIQTVYLLLNSPSSTKRRDLLRWVDAAVLELYSPNSHVRPRPNHFLMALDRIISRKSQIELANVSLERSRVLRSTSACGDVPGEEASVVSKQFFCEQPNAPFETISCYGTDIRSWADISRKHCRSVLLSWNALSGLFTGAPPLSAARHRILSS